VPFCAVATRAAAVVLSRRSVLGEVREQTMRPLCLLRVGLRCGAICPALQRRHSDRILVCRLLYAGGLLLPLAAYQPDDGTGEAEHRLSPKVLLVMHRSSTATPGAVVTFGSYSERPGSPASWPLQPRLHIAH
jgi:hypothetical protein